MAKEETKKTETVEAPATATAQATAPAQPQPDPMALSIGDLKGLASVIDVASTRGAFKANELAGVGILYNKLQAFLAKMTPEQQPAGTVGAVAPTTVAPATAEGK